MGCRSCHPNVESQRIVPGHYTSWRLYLEVPVIEADTGCLVAHAGDVDYAGSFTELVGEEVGEKERADVVGSKLALDAVVGFGIFLDGHDAGVVDQDIDLAHAGVDLGGGLANRLLIAKLEGDELSLDAGVHLLDLLEDGGNLPFTPASEDDFLGAGCCEGESSLGAQTAFAGAGDDDDFAIGLGGEGLDDLLAGGGAGER